MLNHLWLLSNMTICLCIRYWHVTCFRLAPYMQIFIDNKSFVMNSRKVATVTKLKYRGCEMKQSCCQAFIRPDNGAYYYTMKKFCKPVLSLLLVQSCRTVHAVGAKLVSRANEITLFPSCSKKFYTVIVIYSHKSKVSSWYTLITAAQNSSKVNLKQSVPSNWVYQEI